MDLCTKNQKRSPIFSEECPLNRGFLLNWCPLNRASTVCSVVVEFLCLFFKIAINNLLQTVGKDFKFLGSSLVRS